MIPVINTATVLTSAGVTDAVPTVGTGASFTGDSNIGVNTVAGTVFLRVHNASSATRSSASASTGFIGASRASSTSFTLRCQSVSSIEARTSEAPSADAINVFRRTASASFLYTNARIAFYSIGESLDLAKLDARVTDLINAFGAAIL